MSVEAEQRQELPDKEAALEWLHAMTLIRRFEEELLLDYGQHQRRLFPLLRPDLRAGLRPGGRGAQCHRVFSGETTDEKTRRELESRAAGTKALGTWHATRTIQECREACGGAGYLVVAQHLASGTEVIRRVEAATGDTPPGPSSTSPAPAPRTCRGSNPTSTTPSRNSPARASRAS